MQIWNKNFYEKHQFWRQKRQLHKESHESVLIIFKNVWTINYYSINVILVIISLNTDDDQHNL